MNTLASAPQRAIANAGDQFQMSQTVQPPQFAQYQAPPQFHPDPTLGNQMRNRNWAGREQQMYYEMAQAPLPHQYSQYGGHPAFESGQGSQLTQWMAPNGPPTGFAARRGSVMYSQPGVTPGMVRPTYAYNRLVGQQNRMPTMYAAPGTWPNQYYPGGNNTFVPSWEATGIIIKYTREPSRFRINKWAKEITVPRNIGYYLTLDADSPYRVQSVNEYLWPDSADSPGGRQERQAFGFVPYITARLCFPFNLGMQSVQQAEWPILAEHAAVMAAKAMTVRTLLMYNLLSATANWSGPGFTNTGAVSGSWSASSVTNNFIQKDINTAMITIEQATGGIVTDEEALYITMNPQEGRGVAVSGEYKTYIQGSPDALAAITDQRNPNRKYGLAPFLYGLALVVENAVIVTSPKSANATTITAQTRNYIWAQSNVLISSKPQGIVAEGEQTLDFSTCSFRFVEQMTTESKTDSDNRREIGRVVENYVPLLTAPQSGFLLTGAS